MKLFFGLLLTFGFSLSAFSIELFQLERQVLTPINRSACDVLVSFGSEERGIDRDIADKIKMLVIENQGVAEGFTVPRGTNGESHLCLKMKNKESETSFFGEIKRLLSLDHLKSWVSVRSRESFYKANKTLTSN